MAVVYFDQQMGQNHLFQRFNLILTSKQHAKHLFVCQNTQQKASSTAVIIYYSVQPTKAHCTNEVILLKLFLN